MATRLSSVSRPQLDAVLPRPGIVKVALGTALGTTFAWYGFYLFGILAVFFPDLFLPQDEGLGRSLLLLAAFATAFAVRPIGAAIFGTIGDRLGRKRVFTLTMTIMAGATAGIGLLPTYETFGYLAPVLLILLGLVQGLVMGGEYGGALVYVAEQAPAERRGFFTSWVQITATLGLALALFVTLSLRALFGDDAFMAWGWRLALMLSVVLLVISSYVRMSMRETQLFEQLQERREVAASPLGRLFGDPDLLRRMILLLLGATAGQAVVWYMAQFHALHFLATSMRLDDRIAEMIMVAAMVLAVPLFIFFGHLSDRIGRKRIILGGLLLAALTAVPLFKSLQHYANPALEAASLANPVRIEAPVCDYQYLAATQVSPCAAALAYLIERGIAPELEIGGGGAQTRILVGDQAALSGFDADALGAALADAGYPDAAARADINVPMLLICLVLLISYVAMVYAPLGAYMTELFPTPVRMTGLSIPYHVGNGWFGGFLPVISMTIVVATGDLYAGLVYPIVVAVISLVVGGLLLPDGRRGKPLGSR